MLQVTSLRGARSADYYVGLADDQERRDGRERVARGPADYYVDSGEPPGRWWGAQADSWGLMGSVESDDLRRLLDGKHPHTGAQLGRAYSDGGVRPSVRGFDATFSMPKSVSILWAITSSPEVRAEIEAAGWAAVTATLDHLQRVGAVTRVGPAGAQLQVDTGGLAGAIFEQHTNRSAEPQLHWHAVVGAKVDAGQGRWRALDAQFLKLHQSSLGYVFQAAVRSELTARLGVGWGGTVKGAADLAGIDRSVIEGFATRSTEVEAAYARLLAQWQETTGRDLPNRLEHHRLRQAAALASRAPKERGYHPEDLHAGWQAELRLAGIEPAALERTMLRQRPASPNIEATVVAERALSDVSAERGQWHHAEMMKALAARLPVRAATAAQLVTALDALATSTLEAQAIALSPEPPAGVQNRADGRPVIERVVERTWTTPQLWNAEERLASWALVAELMGARGQLSPARGDGLDSAQLDAAAEVAGTRPLVVLVGPAGSGKTRLLEAARLELTAAGRPVAGFAVAAATAQRLADDTGLPCETVAKLLHSAALPEHLGGRVPAAGTTLVIDEATQVSTLEWQVLVDLAEQNRWRLVAVGDPGQIGAVGPGGVFAAWADQYRWTVELDQVHRFTAEWERDASLRLRVGDTDVLSEYADHERIHRTSAGAVAADVVTHWDRHRRGRGDVLVSTGSNRLAGELSAAIQVHRIRCGELPADGRSAPVAGGHGVHEAEPLVTRHNDRHLLTSTGEWVRNGHRWTVTKVHDHGAVTAVGREPGQGEVTLPAAYLVEHAQLGYVVTRHVAQGATVDVGITVTEPGTDRAHLYSGMTRGRHENHVLVVCDTADQEPLAILEDALSHDRQARTAHQVRDQLIERHDALAKHWGWERPLPAERKGAEHTQLARSPSRRLQPPETHAQALTRIATEVAAIELANLRYNSQAKLLRQELQVIDQGRGPESAQAHRAWEDAAHRHRQLLDRPPRFRADRALDRSQQSLDQARGRWEQAKTAEAAPHHARLIQVEQVMRIEWTHREALLHQRDQHAWYAAHGGANLPTGQQVGVPLDHTASPRKRAQLEAIDAWHHRHAPPQHERARAGAETNMQSERTIVQRHRPITRGTSRDLSR